jgi:diguanylate cyclase (GGDEF)-like protein
MAEGIGAFFNTLLDQPPELILLDMNMPGASGQEIAKVIRQQDAYLSIPIVFLSAESDVGRQREAMSLGGDEFLQKPIQPEHLVSAVRSRIIRYRALRALMVRDSLTGLLNHTSYKERLRAEVARAKRQNKKLSVAIIDIDHFKNVNDSYGHPAGDRVIKNLSRLLKQRLRGADVIGRYGGEEFALALPDTPLDRAMIVIDNLRESFAAIEQHTGSTLFHNTFSAGVAEFSPQQPLLPDSEALIKAADEALYVSKHGGRNRVSAASPV